MSSFAKGFRTFIIAGLGAAIGGVALIEDPNDWRSWAILILSIAMAGMRALTSTPPAQG
jgi:hypothetical protein